ncbi:flippase [bacterium]|nr:flippase [bacterium]
MRNSTQNTLQNIGGVFFAQSGDGILRFLISILIARFFLVEEYGFLNFIYAWSAYLLLFSDFGLQQVLVRDISQNREKKLQLYFNACLIRFFIAVILVTAVSVNILFFSDYGTYKILIVELVFVTILLNAVNPSSIYDSFGVSRYDASLKLLSTLLYAIGAVVVLLILNIKYLPLIILLAILAQFLYVLTSNFLFHKKISPLSLKFDGQLVKKLIREGRIIVWARLMAQVYTNMDLIMINILKGDRETGYYAIAYKLLFAAIALNAAMYRVFLPLISALKNNLEALTQKLETTGKVLTFTSLPITVMGIVFADKIILLFYTAKYSPSILALRILLIYVALVGIGAIYGSTLFAIGKNRTYTFAITLGAISNIALNFALIPRYSFIGASIATLLSQFVVVLYTFLKLRRIIKFDVSVNILKFLSFSILATSASYILTEIFGVNFIVAISAGIFIYLSICIFSGAISKTELNKAGITWFSKK